MIGSAADGAETEIWKVDSIGNVILSAETGRITSEASRVRAADTSDLRTLMTTKGTGDLGGEKRKVGAVDSGGTKALGDLAGPLGVKTGNPTVDLKTWAEKPVSEAVIAEIGTIRNAIGIAVEGWTGNETASSLTGLGTGTAQALRIGSGTARRETVIGTASVRCANGTWAVSARCAVEIGTAAITGTKVNRISVEAGEAGTKI
jgi:hypothetical protein